MCYGTGGERTEVWTLWEAMALTHGRKKYSKCGMGKGFWYDPVPVDECPLHTTMGPKEEVDRIRLSDCSSVGLEGVTNGRALLVGNESYNHCAKGIFMAQDKDDFIPART